jgi:hypothetical protein
MGIRAFETKTFDGLINPHLSIPSMKMPHMPNLSAMRQLFLLL